jgi:hypothetical protein
MASGPGTGIGGERVLWTGAALGGLALHLLLWQISEPAEIFSDFFKANYRAAEALIHDGPHAIWDGDEPFAVGFVNIPILAWLTVPLVRLGEAGAAWTFLALGAAATIAAFFLLRRLTRLDRWRAPALLFLFLVNGPLVNSLREGNTTHFILLLLVAALLLWRAGREFAAGFALGVCAVFKLPFLLFGAYFLLRRRWRIVAGGATSIGLTVALSLAVFGAEINGAWIRCCVEPFAKGVMPAFNVQSIDGFLMRLVTGESQLQVWEPQELSVAHKVARLAIFAVLYGAVFWLIWRSERAPPPAQATTGLAPRDYREYALVLVLALATSPVSWTHYYLLLLLPFALWLGGRLPLPDDAATRRLMWGALAVASAPVVILPLEADWLGAVASRTVVSAHLFAGLLMLAALVRGARGAARFARRETGLAESRT